MSQMFVSQLSSLLIDAIPAKIKLEDTLSFVSTGNSYRSLSHLFRLPKSSISQIISEVCQEIKRALKDHIKVPSTPHEWEQIEKGFRNKWNFPLCYGALDGKHINITGSKEYGSVNFNYKKDNSIVLMALVDHDYCFTYINVGANGSASDGGILKNCSIYSLIEGTWRTEVRALNSITHQGSNHSSSSAREKRTQYTIFFVNEGKVPWQNNMIH
ncbi:unnamed protein product [Pieris macdunnoughi]|uniref:DDE Tnp4 domain-containing protein n=1 Tax=Pieris macdunnoughi TaxID=345717 RepID=A0A821MW73_9NEOP|nr:unnamed protein product [Pieris macdunnoughi]